MTRPDLLGAVPTATGCEWALPGRRVPSPVEPGAELVRFLDDQQDLVQWHLHLRPDGGHSVVCGRPGADASGELIEVAPGFEPFLYRFWVENTAGFEVAEQRREWAELSAPVRDYLASYRR
jgi:hypothetical protein